MFYEDLFDPEKRGDTQFQDVAMRGQCFECLERFKPGDKIATSFRISSDTQLYFIYHIDCHYKHIKKHKP